MDEDSPREQIAPPPDKRASARVPILLAVSGVVLATALGTVATVTTASKTNTGQSPNSGHVQVNPYTGQTVGTSSAAASTTAPTTTTTAPTAPTTTRRLIVTTTSGPHGITTVTIPETTSATTTTAPTTTTTTTTAPTTTAPTTTTDPSKPGK
jgi:hypothetical protein